jgi:hypothetical protein
MDCPGCRAKIPDMAKFCPECGTRLSGSGVGANISDSVVTHSPGIGSNYAPVINVSGKEQYILRCPNCEMEISNENKPLKCLECGTKFCENCEKWYRKEDRQQGEKPLCEKCYTNTIKQSGTELQAPTTTFKVAEDLNPFKAGEDEFDYIEFFNDIRKIITPEVPDSGDPDGHIWYRIPAGISGAHFEFYFELYKWRRLGVELHFETGNPRWNQAMLSEMVKYTRLIEQKTGEKVYVQRNWGRPVIWSRLYLANTRLDNVDELKKWASEKMIIFYRILQPRLKELR